jgi:virginiamycin B lyase
LLGNDRPLTWTIKYDVFYNLKRPDIMIDYLAKSFGPDIPPDPRVVGRLSHPNRNLPTTLLKGTAAKYVAMEFSLPSGSMPSDVAVDSQGVVWVSERNTGMIGRFDANSLTYTRIASPPAKNPKFQLNSIAVDPRGQVWYVDDGPNARMLQYNPKSREFNSYPIPDYRWPVSEIGWARIATLRFLDNNVWGTGITAERVLKLDPSTRKVTEYSVPRGSAPLGLAIGGNNMIWYAAEVGNAIVRLDPTDGRLTPHQVPTPRSDLRGMAADAEGNLWVAATESGKLVKVDNRTGNATEFTVPSEGSGPYSVDIDTKRNLVWFSENFTDKIGRFDPRANSFVEFPQPSAASDLRRIEIDRSNPNRVWWSGARADKIGYIEVIDEGTN